MSGMMVDGTWKTEDDIPRENGRFRRSTTSFRGWISSDGGTDFPAEAGRYHLYVAWACPWAHRTAILRRLKGLEDAIGLSAVGSFMGDDGWAFYEEPGVIPDTVNGAHFLREVYAKADPGYTGRVTTPVLWDKERGTIVNNESREIVRMLDTEFGGIARADVDFAPDDLREEIDSTIDALYEPINHGVYRPGLAHPPARGAVARRGTRRAAARGSPPRRRPRRRPSPTSSTPWTTGREFWRRAATCAATASRRPTGACSRRWCASTWSTTGTSSATSAA